MFVLSPLSCIVQVDGAPTLGSFSLCAASNARHSGSVLSCVDEITIPQDWQTSSPASSSLRSLVPPHSVQEALLLCWATGLLTGIIASNKAYHIIITKFLKQWIDLCFECAFNNSLGFLPLGPVPCSYLPSA